MKIPIIPQDKANHFVYGFVIYFLFNLFLNQYTSFSIVFLFAISKEIYDEYKYSGFDWRDLVTTLIPAFLLTLKNLIL
jgi:hypothetical protein